VTTGVLDGIPHYFLAACMPFSFAAKIEMPIFTPNEYFWKHHQKEGEEKWETYMRTMRSIMAKHGNL